MLYDALSGTPKKHARKVPEGVRLSYQGYGAIARVLIQEYSGYLEIEFEVSVIRVLHNFPTRKRDELYCHFISKCQMLFDELDEQLYPDRFNERIKAVMLLHAANLSEQQQIQLCLKKGRQSNMGRTYTAFENAGSSYAFPPCVADCVQ